MPRLHSTLTALALAAAGALAGSACSESAGAPPLPALPAGLASLDPEVAGVVQDAHAALRASPQEAARWGAFGFACEANGLFDPAAEGYAGASALDDQELRWRYRRAVCHAKLGRLAAGVEEMRAAVALDPDFAPARVRLGELLLDLGESERARAALVEATRLGPQDRSAWWGLARAELEHDALEPAIAAARRALELAPDEPYAHHLLGTALRRAGRPDEARAHLALGARAGRVTVDPFIGDLTPYRPLRARRYDQIATLTESGRHAEAIPVLEALLADEPDSQFALNKLAIALGTVGRAGEALPHLARALEREPENLRTHLNMAVALEATGRTDAALAQLERILALEPLLARAHQLKGRILRDHGRYREALPALRRAVELDERNPEVWIWIGSIHLDQGEWAPAHECFERAATLAPENADALALQAVACSRIGRRDEAEELMRRARGLAPTGSPVLEMCQRALAELGSGGR